MPRAYVCCNFSAAGDMINSCFVNVATAGCLVDEKHQSSCSF